MAESITITGLKETQRSLYRYSQQLGDRVVLGSLRQGANLVKRAAQSNAPFESGKLKKGIRVYKSKIHRGRMSNDLIGVYISIAHKKKDDPYYGRFQEDGWNTHGARKGSRLSITSLFGARTGRKTQRGKTDVPGKKFIEQAWLANRAEAVELIRRSAIAGAEVLARKMGL